MTNKNLQLWTEIEMKTARALARVTIASKAIEAFEDRLRALHPPITAWTEIDSKNSDARIGWDRHKESESFRLLWWELDGTAKPLRDCSALIRMRVFEAGSLDVLLEEIRDRLDEIAGPARS